MAASDAARTSASLAPSEGAPGLLPIAIAGAGIGGASAALALHLAGLPVVAYERAAEPRESGAAIGASRDHG